MTISLQGQEFLLLPERALFHPESRSLICSDVHIGKTTDLLRSGIQVPMETAEANFILLGSLITRYDPASLYVLGDLFHSRRNKEFDRFAVFIEAHKGISFTLVKGNHDFLADSIYEALGLNVMNEVSLDGIRLAHEANKEAISSITGHIHPKVKLRGKGRQSASLAVFARTREQLLLPAFGRMTGGHFIRPEHYDDIYLCGREKVLKWNGKPEGTRSTR